MQIILGANVAIGINYNIQSRILIFGPVNNTNYQCKKIQAC